MTTGRINQVSIGTVPLKLEAEPVDLSFSYRRRARSRSPSSWYLLDSPSQNLVETETLSSSQQCKAPFGDDKG